jgi:hypothetical protein
VDDDCDSLGSCSREAVSRRPGPPFRACKGDASPATIGPPLEPLLHASRAHMWKLDARLEVRRGVESRAEQSRAAFGDALGANPLDPDIGQSPFASPAGAEAGHTAITSQRGSVRLGRLSLSPLRRKSPSRSNTFDVTSSGLRN